MNTSMAAVLASIAIVAGCGTGEPPGEGAQGASVLLFLVDTLRADRLSPYGHERDTSPRLDALADQGVVVENCLAQSTWTKPTTASILTGLYPAEHGAVYVNATIDRKALTLAQRLSASGYRTAAFVANGMVVGGPVGFDRGFESFVPYFPNEEPRGYVRAGRVVRDALEWLGGLADEPFFLYVHVMDPHAPYDPPPPFDQRYGGTYSGNITGYSVLEAEMTPSDLSDADWQRLRDLYDAEIAYVDSELGRLLDGLDALGRGDDTVVAFVSDHGEEFDDHGGWQHNPRMFQEVLHVPLVFRFPDLPDALRGSRFEETALQIDIVPTLLDAVGLERSGDLRGNSILGLLMGTEERAQPYAFSEVERSGYYNKSVVQDRMKYVRSWSPHPGEKLFDLKTDPDERDDLAGEQPDRVAELRGALDAYMAGNASGYSMVLRNRTDTLAQGLFLIATEHEPVVHASFLFAEEGAADHRRNDTDGPLQWELSVENGRSRYLTRYQVRTSPGDEDGIAFELDPEETTISVAVIVDGVLMQPEDVRLGAAGVRPDEMPFEVDLTGRNDLLATGFDVLSEGSTSGYTLFLWENVGTRTERADLPEDLLRNLEALGYVEED